jgi:hypothetical protein
MISRHLPPDLPLWRSLVYLSVLCGKGFEACAYFARASFLSRSLTFINARPS